MMAIVIEGVKPWDGRYDFEDFQFTQREYHRIKQLSGIRAGELLEALVADDTAAVVGVAMVVLERNGVKLDPDDLWNSKIGSITLDLGEPDAVPPEQPPGGGESVKPSG